MRSPWTTKSTRARGGAPVPSKRRALRRSVWRSSVMVGLAGADTPDDSARRPNGHAGPDSDEPVFDLEVAELLEVAPVAGHEDEVVHDGDGGYLTVDVRRGQSESDEASPFGRVPLGGVAVVWQDVRRNEHARKVF